MKVLCTNGVKSVMLDLVPAFERKTGTKLTLTRLSDTCVGRRSVLAYPFTRIG